MRFERDIQLRQANVMLGVGIGEIIPLPAEQLYKDRSDIGDGVFIVVQKCVEAFLMRTDVSVDNDATLDQNRGCDREPYRPDKAEPFVVCRDGGAGSAGRFPSPGRRPQRRPARRNQSGASGAAAERAHVSRASRHADLYCAEPIRPSFSESAVAR